MANQSGFAGINGCPVIIPQKQGTCRQMTDHEARAAWRLFTLNWIPIALMALALALCLALTKFSIKPESALFSLGAIALYAGIAYYNARRSRRHSAVVAFMFGSAAQLFLITALMTPLTYIAAALDLPMQDANLAALDRALGLDWRAYLVFVNERPWLIGYLALGYALIAWPVFGVPVLLGATRRFGRLQQFTVAFALALVATTILSTLAPALGTYHQLGISPADYTHLTPGGYLDQLRDFPRVRDGSLRELDIVHLVGIITFPSFHAAACVLYLWALWAVWWMRPIVVLTNGLMLLSTPIGGGHYFVDIFAGMAVAVLAIAAANRLSAWLTQGSSAPLAAMSMPGAAVPAE
jgi:hypothetical protein